MQLFILPCPKLSRQGRGFAQNSSTHREPAPLACWLKQPVGLLCVVPCVGRCHFQGSLLENGLVEQVKRSLWGTGQDCEGCPPLSLGRGLLGLGLPHLDSPHLDPLTWAPLTWVPISWIPLTWAPLTWSPYLDLPQLGPPHLGPAYLVPLPGPPSTGFPSPGSLTWAASARSISSFLHILLQW
jgi:hypothetical protein